ncbi:MAG: hypothetical protein K5765_06935 [Clostridia bacterium]|nr:hypothetical protein [Clostridia bacterium]
MKIKWIEFNGCEVVKENCIKVRRSEIKEEPKKDEMVEWLACGFVTLGKVYHKDINYIYIKVVG